MSFSARCSNCSAEIPPGATLCPACGFSSKLGGDQSPPGRRTCAVCGAIAPIQATNCSICTASLSNAIDLIEGDEYTYWVGVRCEFQCRSCGHVSPLNSLDLDGSVQCLHCSLKQAFDVESWYSGLDHAHAVGDLAPPPSEGRSADPHIWLGGVNPYKEVGITQASSLLALSGSIVREGVETSRSLRVDAFPGQPLCEQCRSALQIDLQGSQAVTSCTGCGDRATYQMPPGSERLHRGLRAIIAEDHRIDRQEIQLDHSGGGHAIALKCPNCGAGLQADMNSRIVTCQFCHTLSRIPEKTFFSVFDKAPTLETWWMLFSGPSNTRSALLAPGNEQGMVRIPEKRDDQPILRKLMSYGVPLAMLLITGAAILVAFIGTQGRAQAWMPDSNNHFDNNQPDYHQPLYQVPSASMGGASCDALAACCAAHPQLPSASQICGQVGLWRTLGEASEHACSTALQGLRTTGQAMNQPLPPQCR